MCVRVAVHLDDPLFKSQTLMTPIVSPVYRTAEMSEIALPSRHSTGLVCEEIVPRLFNGSGRLKFERSLNQHKLRFWAQLIIYYLSRTYQNRTILSELPVTKIWRLGNTSRVLTKSSWASGVEDISSLVYCQNHYDLVLCLRLEDMTYDCIPKLD